MRPAEDLTTTKRKRSTMNNKQTNIEVKLSKMTKLPESDPERSSPDPNCSICLSKMNDKSFTDRCFHMFCYDCLVEWSKINAVCPLCKQPFKQIFHNIKSMSEYAVYDVHSHPSAYIQGDYNSDNNPLLSSSQGFLTDMGLVAMFLGQPSNQRAFNSWLKEHIRDYLRVDVMQSSFLADVIIGLLKMFNLSSGQFYDTINRFFGEQTGDFIRSLDVNLHTFIFHGIREPSFDQSHQQNTHFLPESERRGNQAQRISPVLANRSTINYIDFYLRQFTRPDVTDGLAPGPSRISFVLSLLKPSSNSTRANAGSSSSSSSPPPPEEELIDIEQLDDSLQRSRHVRNKSPICVVSSEEEDHVQLVECSSSRVRPRVRSKRKQTTFLLVSSDDEASIESESVQESINVSKKQKTLKPSENLSADEEESESTVTRDNKTGKDKIKDDVKITFKKHPTGHKNSLKKNRSIMLENQNLSEKSSEVETSQIVVDKQDYDVTGDINDLPSSSSSYQPERESVLPDANAESENVVALTVVKQIFQADGKQQPSSNQITTDTKGQDNSKDDKNNDIVLNEEIVDIDAISLYSDDSIQLLDGDTTDYCINSDDEYIEESKVSCRKRKNEFDDGNLDIEVLNETSMSDIFIISSSVSRRKKLRRSSSRATHIFVDLSDDNFAQEVSISEPSASGLQNFVPILQHTSDDDDDKEFSTLIANNYDTNAVFLQNTLGTVVDCHSDVEQSACSVSQLVEVLRDSDTAVKQDSLDITEGEVSLDLSRTSICIENVKTSNEKCPLTTSYENLSSDTSDWAVDSIDVNI